MIAIGVHYAAYCSEVYRAGFDNIPRGQWEASVALNLSSWTTFRDIIIPQAIPPVVPALGNYLVALFKETPLLSAIAVLELMQTAKIIGSETFRYTEPITLVGLFFLAMSLVSALLIRGLEELLNRRTDQMSEQPMVRFDKVSKRYGSLTVLDGLDLEIGRGEKVSIIGPSGSGKTTVLRMLMTLETINDGVIWVEGEPLTHMQKNGGLVPADTAHVAAHPLQDRHGVPVASTCSRI